MNNKQRIKRAVAALSVVYKNGDRGHDIIDLLTDLQHLCREEGRDFDDCLRIARNHFQVEKPVIEITVEGGIVQDICHLRPGEEVHVFDYDCTEEDEDTEKDGEGNLRRRIIFQG